MSSESNIRVVVRFRPQNKREIKEGGIVSSEFGADGLTVSLDSKENSGSCIPVDFLLLTIPLKSYL